jgi:aspartyl-tRNA(Asn)/glutamyl-tRNA(Gln) amidotransferase subunit C
VETLSGISKEQVHQIAHLARLEISEEEAGHFANELDQMLQMAEVLNELDTAQIEPTSHVFDQKNVMREDIPEKGLSLDELMKNVPDHEGGYIKVPAILE